MKSKINSILQTIRDCVNEPYNATGDKDIYFSALDVLEDTLEAIDYYKQNPFIKNTGYKYLVIHGLLESLYMQQEALKDLYSFLFDKNLNFKTDYHEIYEIREIRNDISGHPSSRGLYSTYLSRASLEKEGFIYTKNLTGKPINVETIKIIEQQEKFLAEFLNKKILKLLKARQDEHYRKFKNSKLVKCFDSLAYANEKVYVEGIFYTDKDSLGFSIVENILKKFEKMIDERYIDWKKSKYSYEIQEVHNIIDFLKSNELIMNEVNENNKFIKRNLLENMFTKLYELYDIAKIIDEKYEKYFLSESKKTKKNTTLPPIIVKDENEEEIALHV